MSIWFSPFPLAADLQGRLERCGWSAWRDAPLALPPKAILIYPLPDELLCIAETSTTPDDMVAGYQHLLALSEQHRLISCWRLQACSDAQLQEGRLEAQDQPLGWPCPNSLTAVITRHVLDTTPAMLNAYLDLELKADLLGGEPDTLYQKRLTANLNADELLQAWRQPPAISAELTDTQRQLTEAREETEIILHQLHLAQEELTQHFLLSESQKDQQESHKKQLTDTQRQLTEAREELEQLRIQVEQSNGLQTDLSTTQRQLAETKEEVELTLLQLHLVQEELERYFLLSESQKAQQERQKKLLRSYERLVSSVVARS